MEIQPFVGGNRNGVPAHTRALHKNMVLITLAVPGIGPAGVSVKQSDRVLTITVKARQLAMQVDVSEDLEVLRVR